MQFKLYQRKRSTQWYADFGIYFGQRVRRCSGTTEKKKADEWAKRYQTELWEQERTGKRPTVIWDVAVIEWINDHTEGRSVDAIDGDTQRLRLFSKHFKGRNIETITAEEIRRIVSRLSGIASSTRNRYMTTAISILNYAHRRKWRSTPEKQIAYTNPEPRVRYLTPVEADRLLAELPEYLRVMATFALATGLRESNVRLLEWSRVDMGRSIAWIRGSQVKSGKDLTVPLNNTAMSILDMQMGKHWKWVFPLRDAAISKCNNLTFRNAVKRAGIDNFKWHDLRHTWASWHVQNGTSLYDLKTLGGWASMVMVERYAHMSDERVAKVCTNIDGIWHKTGTHPLVATPPPTPRTAPGLVGRAGLEPATPTMSRAVTKRGKQDLSNNIIDLAQENLSRRAPQFPTRTADTCEISKVKVAQIWHTKKGVK